MAIRVTFGDGFEQPEESAAGASLNSPVASADG